MAPVHLEFGRVIACYGASAGRLEHFFIAIHNTDQCWMCRNVPVLFWCSRLCLNACGAVGGEACVHEAGGWAATWRVDKNAYVWPADALHDISSDGVRPLLCVSQVIKSCQASGQEAHVSTQKPKRHLSRLLPSCVTVLRLNRRLPPPVREGTAHALKRRPQQETQQSERRRDEEQDEEEQRAKKDLERVEVALFLASPPALRRRGHTRGDESVQEPEAGKDEAPSQGVKRPEEAIRKGGFSQKHSSSQDTTTGTRSDPGHVRSSPIRMGSSIQSPACGRLIPLQITKTQAHIQGKLQHVQS